MSSTSLLQGTLSPLLSPSDVKIGGLSFFSDFSIDPLGGLRTNFPGRKDFLPPEYWQGSLSIVH